MPSVTDDGDIRVSPEGELVVTTFQRSNGQGPLRIQMERKQAARYVLMLQTCLRGLNGQEPWPDHPGYADEAT